MVNCARSRVFAWQMLDRGFALHQHERHRLADDVARADDHDVAAFDRNLFVLEQPDDAIGRARREHGVADDEPAHVVEMEPVDVFLGGNGAQHAPHVDVRRQGKLHENAVDRRDRGPALRWWPTSESVAIPDGNSFLEDWMPTSRARAYFVCDIKCRGGIVPDQHDREPRNDAGLAAQRFHPDSAFLTNARCDFLAVDDFGDHALPSALFYSVPLVAGDNTHVSAGFVGSCDSGGGLRGRFQQSLEQSFDRSTQQ